MSKPPAPKPDGRRGPKDKPWTRLPRPSRRRGARIGREGERISDYHAVTLRAPRALHARLKALAEVRGEPLWALLVEAAEAFIAAQDAGTRARLEKRARQLVREFDKRDTEAE